MPGNIEDLEWAQETFAAAVKIKEAAEELLALGAGFAGPAACLCNQSAQRMMFAFSILLGQDYVGAENTEDLWYACIAARKEIKVIDAAVQTLIACEWADYPDFRQRLDSDYARDAINCVQQLEQAMLEIAPELAASTEQSMGMGQSHLP